jgi:hypothetical protein
MTAGARAGRRALLLAIIGSSGSLGGPGCDASYSGFLGAVPVTDYGQEGPVDVFIAVDGLSRQAYDRARAAGAFASFSDGDLVTAFPGTSDYAWTRTLGTGSVPGYEMQYFDPGDNRLHKQGLGGVIEHPIREGLAGSLPCYQRFDFLGDGYLWMARGYQDPEAALPATMDEMFAVLVRRSRQQPRFLAYLLNVDVIGHKGGLDRTVAALVDIDRRLQRFRQQHPGRFRFTLFGDHGNAHLRARLIDPREVMRRAGVTPVEQLPGGEGPGLAAVPVVHVRVTYVALHTRPEQAAAVAARLSTQPEVELAVAALGPDASLGFGARRYGLWRAGEAFSFSRLADGGYRLDQPARWAALGLVPVAGAEDGLLDDEQARAASAAGPFPDLLYRVATAFTHPAAVHPASVLLSLPDDVASFGFHVPGSGDGVAVDGFHGGLGRGGSISVLASEAFPVPAAVRSDDLRGLLGL